MSEYGCTLTYANCKIAARAAQVLPHGTMTERDSIPYGLSHELHGVTYANIKQLVTFCFVYHVRIGLIPGNHSSSTT